MGLLFDDETIREIHDYNVRLEGVQEGRQLEKERGIRAIVSALQEYSIDREKVVKVLAEQYSLTPQEAEEKVSAYWVP